jgi:hypothetical protein
MSKMINFARLQVGKPYVFGRSGPDSFDCSGLTKRAAAQIGLDLYHGATMQFNRGTATGPPERYGYFDQTGPIETLPADRVAFLFNQDKTKTSLVMAHTGLYDGAGRVIQAGGQYRGVSDKPINKKRWSHWATLSKTWEDRDMADADEGGFQMRRGSKGAAVKDLQTGLIRLGYDLGRYGADGDFGQATEAAVKKFQADNRLPVDGAWDAECQERLTERLGIVGEYKPPQEKIDRIAMLIELQNNNRRDGIVIAALLTAAQSEG